MHQLDPHAAIEPLNHRRANVGIAGVQTEQLV
jgi:hypothetical protein